MPPDAVDPPRLTATRSADRPEPHPVAPPQLTAAPAADRRPEPPRDKAEMMAAIQTLHDRLGLVERLLGPEARVIRGAQRVLPAWQRVTLGEQRWQISIALLVAIGLQMPLPDRLVLLRPIWLLPVLEGLLLVGLLVANPGRMERTVPALRIVDLGLVGLISLANLWSAGRLVVGLVNGTDSQNAAGLLLAGGAIWLTNVIVFALWYWETDRGGPAARATARMPYPDFQFPQMVSPELAPPDWEPRFLDYLYLSFTNATAFSPTDVMPLSRWAKTAMMVQSAVSVVVVALVVARAVNVLK